MKSLPFIVKGYGKTCFRCLAYAEVIVRIPRAQKGPGAMCGLYLPSSKQEGYYRLKVFKGGSSIGPNPLAGLRRHGVGAALLYAQIYHKIPPSAWRLYPLGRRDSSAPAYRRERRVLSEFLWCYRMFAGCVTRSPDFRNALVKPFFETDRSRSRLGVGLDKSEDKEFEAAMLRQARAENAKR